MAGEEQAAIAEQVRKAHVSCSTENVLQWQPAAVEAAAACLASCPQLCYNSGLALHVERNKQP
jgi:hypothetical protein